MKGMRGGKGTHLIHLKRRERGSMGKRADRGLMHSAPASNTHKEQDRGNERKQEQHG